MKKNGILGFLFFGLIAGCSNDKEIDMDCVNTKLEEFNMVRYTGQEIGCEFFLELYHYKNKQYFLLGSHCADIVAYPTDCNGDRLCGEGEASSCARFYKNSVRIGIVGISE